MTNSGGKLPCIARARPELEAGRVWRAKEILRGNIASAGYNCDLYVEYGELLLRAGELPEAGKYLFLSGVRKEHFQVAIDLYLRRHGSSWRNLLGTFPNGGRLLQRNFYPQEVAEYLEGLGAPPGFEEAEFNPGQFGLPPVGKGRANEFMGCLGAFIVGSGWFILLVGAVVKGFGAAGIVPGWVWLVISVVPSLAFVGYWFRNREDA